MNKPEKMPAEVRFGWALLLIGVVLVVAGLIFRQLLNDAGPLGRLVMTFGIFLGGWGLVSLNKNLLTFRDPRAARRLAIEAQDERSLSIRNKAGYESFVFALVISAVGLLIYSVLSQDQKGFDLLWWYLAFLVVGPGVFYVVRLISFHQKF